MQPGDEEQETGLYGDDWDQPVESSEAGGLAPLQGSPNVGDISNSRLAKNLDLQRRIQAQHAVANDAINQGMGANAQQRWSGTPAVGLGMFKRRDPIFAVSGVGRDGQPRLRQRIDASTHMATPPSGLIGGQALQNASQGIYGGGGRPTAFTPQQTWEAQFQPKQQDKQPVTSSSESGAGRFAGIKKMASSGAMANASTEPASDRPEPDMTPDLEYQGPVGKGGQLYGNPGTYRFVKSKYGHAVSYSK